MDRKCNQNANYQGGKKAKSPKSSPAAPYHVSSYKCPLPLANLDQPAHMNRILQVDKYGMTFYMRAPTAASSSDGTSLPRMRICSDVLLDLDLPARSTQSYGLKGHKDDSQVYARP